MPFPVNTPDESAAMLRRLFGLGGGGADVARLAGLRSGRRRELGEQLADDVATNDKADAANRTLQLRMLDDEISSDPFTGDDERDRIAGLQTGLDRAGLTNRQEVDDAARVTSQRNAFGKFLEGEAGYKAQRTPAGRDALDAAARRAMGVAAARGRAGAAGATSDPSAYEAERNLRSRTAVNELLGKVSGRTAGLGSLLGAIPGTDARDFSAQLKTLKSNLAFNELAAMRAASKTGGALGAVSDRELALLESTIGALDEGQSPQNLKEQLTKIGGSLDRWREAQAQQMGGGEGGQAAGSTRRALPPGVTVRRLE